MRWDAGRMGCGELIVGLKQRLATLPPGSSLELLAEDPGVSEDLPAWCRLTGHRLVEAHPPRYVIEPRKEA
ncbi:sulfurtransferase TusA family protein [Haloactinomyces albus]|uniref:tRNA 2-thiouridine synthesizing protein A n=1 Tax=Haloactinomyces albus TaxID=1352928 RepID=A0AAE4CMJ3_9ACTN|nr:sulfurtransferase TusA family protein [Haloactinomyces albus]MDR7302904.1 tRNA 2-thiouridine synthesizing protein A [Haloactinomyces albus]